MDLAPDLGKLQAAANKKNEAEIDRLTSALVRKIDASIARDPFAKVWVVNIPTGDHMTQKAAADRVVAHYNGNPQYHAWHEIKDQPHQLIQQARLAPQIYVRPQGVSQKDAIAAIAESPSRRF